MATYYVGAGGNNSNAGTSWAQRKLTLNGAEDIPVAAGDTVYVGPGVYRQSLACDTVNGTTDAQITYIGDVDGSHTDGVGGIVRITGSDDDSTVTRNYCIGCWVSYRSFRGFVLDSASEVYANFYMSDADLNGIVIENCVLIGSTGIKNANRAIQNSTIRNCLFFTHSNGFRTDKSTTIDNANNLLENCIFSGVDSNQFAVQVVEGGWTVRNCSFIGCANGIKVSKTLNSGQTVTVNNCIFDRVVYALNAVSTGNLVENYNSFAVGTVEVARTNVNVGANSNTYLGLLDVRWASELLNGGTMLTPFDLASYSQLINVAGTSPSTADMRGTTVQGTQREWGALEYDSTLDIEAGSGTGGAVSIQPCSGRLG